MKKTFFVFVFGIMLVGCKHGNNVGSTGSDSTAVRRTEYADIDEMISKWGSRDIAVKPADPDIIDLLAAFHDVWPLPSIGHLLDAARDGDSLVNLDKDDYMLLINRNEGYAYQDMLSDMVENLKTYAFKRDDGSQLLIMQWLGAEFDVTGYQQNFAYEYSPRTKTLKPTENILPGTKAAHPDETLSLWLPDDPTSQLPRVCEYYGNFRYQIMQDCKWDGKRFIVQPMKREWLESLYGLVELRYPDMLFERYAIVGLGGDIYLLLSDAEGGRKALFYQPESGTYSLVACNQGNGELTLYENGVVQRVGCGAGCYNEDYIVCHDGKNETVISVYTAADPDGNIVERTFSLGNDELSQAEGEKRLAAAKEKLGQKAATEPNWQIFGS